MREYQIKINISTEKEDCFDFNFEDLVWETVKESIEKQIDSFLTTFHIKDDISYKIKIKNIL